MFQTILEDKILPAVFNKDGSTLVECKFDSKSVGEDQFQSNVVFLTATVQNKNSSTEIPLVVKFEPHNLKLREFIGTNVQFYNEVVMYTNVLPFLNKNNIFENTFPKFYHGVGTLGDSGNSVVVVEDLRPLGYKLTKDKAFIDYDHLALAMSQLGRFHALSYAAKKEFPDEFYSLARSLKETSWAGKNYYQPIVAACFQRVIDPLINQGKHVEVLQSLMARVEANVMEFMRGLVTPEEPLAVICHGDFCRNNILFKYDQGKPVDVKFFDVATARYSSPVVDIAFIIFLNSSSEVRAAHWDDLLTIYHQSLSTAIPGTEVPSLEDIRNEVQKKAVYGFVHCSFFLPMMLYEVPFEGVDFLLNLSDKEMGEMHARVGGEEGTRLMSNMLEELVGRGCLTLQHKFLQ